MASLSALQSKQSDICVKIDLVMLFWLMVIRRHLPRHVLAGHFSYLQFNNYVLYSDTFVIQIQFDDKKYVST